MVYIHADIMENGKFIAATNHLYVKYKFNQPTGATERLLRVTQNQQKKTIAHLKEEIEKIKFKYDAVFKTTNAYHIILNREFDIIDFNHAYISLMAAVSKKRLRTGENITAYLNSDLCAAVLKNCRRALSGETFAVERQIMLANNQATWWQADYSPAWDGYGHIGGVVINVTDITPRKNHEVKIEMQNIKLRDISLMQSHEIRGPLCTLMGLIDLLNMENIAADTGYMPMINCTITQLDKKVREIVARANE